MEQRFRVVVWSGVFLLVCLFLTYVYLTEFWYRQPQYTLGVLNDTDERINDVELSFAPEGSFPFGVLSTGIHGWHMNPPWPVPDRVTVTFTYDDKRQRFERTKPTSLSKDFEGSLLIAITKNDAGEFDFEIRTPESD